MLKNICKFCNRGLLNCVKKTLLLNLNNEIKRNLVGNDICNLISGK